MISWNLHRLTSDIFDKQRKRSSWRDISTHVISRKTLLPEVQKNGTKCPTKRTNVILKVRKNKIKTRDTEYFFFAHLNGVFGAWLTAATATPLLPRLNTATCKCQLNTQLMDNLHNKPSRVFMQHIWALGWRGWQISSHYHVKSKHWQGSGALMFAGHLKKLRMQIKVYCRFHESTRKGTVIQVWKHSANNYISISAFKPILTDPPFFIFFINIDFLQTKLLDILYCLMYSIKITNSHYHEFCEGIYKFISWRDL